MNENFSAGRGQGEVGAAETALRGAARLVNFLGFHQWVWLVVWNMTFMTFHSVGNFIIRNMTFMTFHILGISENPN